MKYWSDYELINIVLLFVRNINEIVISAIMTLYKGYSNLFDKFIVKFTDFHFEIFVCHV